MRIVLVNCTELPEPDPDERPLLDALRAMGHEALSEAWDDASVAWDRFDAAVVRATWNYAHHAEAFAEWIDRAGAMTTLLNPPEVLRANLDKSYLLDLESRGVPIIPSVFAPRGGTLELAALARERGWGRVVVKPSVSAGSYATRAFEIPRESDAAQAFLDDMLARRGMMVQRYMPSVARGAEVCMIFIDGALTHAIAKQPRFHGEDESVARFEALTDAHHDLAQRVLDAWGPGEPLYARVDLIEDDNGEPVLSELELLEPSLYFGLGDGAAARMASAIERRVAALQS